MVVTIVLKQESYSGNQIISRKSTSNENFPGLKKLPAQRVVQTILLHGRKIEVPEPEDLFLEKKIANSRQGKERPKGYSCLAASALFYHGGNTDYRTGQRAGKNHKQ